MRVKLLGDKNRGQSEMDERVNKSDPWWDRDVNSLLLPLCHTHAHTNTNRFNLTEFLPPILLLLKCNQQAGIFLHTVRCESVMYTV